MSAGTGGSDRTAAELPWQAVTVVKPSSLGDIVHTLPAVAALRAGLPGARLRWVVNTEWAPLLQGSPLVDEVVVFPRRQFRGVGGLLRAARWLAGWRRQLRERPELVIDFQGLLRSGLIAWRRGADRVIGLSDAREGARWLHQQRIAVQPGWHAVDRYLAVPRALGLPTPEPGQVTFPLAPGAPPAGWPVLAAGVRPWVVHPWSRGEGKSLSDAALRALLEGLAPEPVVLLGAGAGLPAGSAWPGQVTNLVNRTTLAELIWCLRQARAVVSVDSGPMHMAAAVNPLTLGLHTWTDPRQVGPYPLSARVWKAGRIDRRDAFSPGECQTTRQVTVEDAAQVARWMRTEWGGPG